MPPSAASASSSTRDLEEPESFLQPEAVVLAKGAAARLKLGYFEDALSDTLRAPMTGRLSSARGQPKRLRSLALTVWMRAAASAGYFRCNSRNLRGQPGRLRTTRRYGPEISSRVDPATG